MKTHSAVLIPGDGIGPEITQAVRRILDAAAAPIEWVERKAGVGALESGPDVLPESTTEAIEHHGVARKGPCTTPVGEGFTSVNVQFVSASTSTPPCVRYGPWPVLPPSSRTWT